MDSNVRTAVIRKCRQRDKDDRPASEQQWCLYTKDGKKLLGRHPSKEKALKQERAIQIRKHGSTPERIRYNAVEYRLVSALQETRRPKRPVMQLGPEHTTPMRLKVLSDELEKLSYLLSKGTDAGKGSTCVKTQELEAILKNVDDYMTSLLSVHKTSSAVRYRGATYRLVAAQDEPKVELKLPAVTKHMLALVPALKELMQLWIASRQDPKTGKVCLDAESFGRKLELVYKAVSGLEHTVEL